MSSILHIAKCEVRKLVFSPIAWVLVIAFAFQAGTSAAGQLQAVLNNLEGGSVTHWALTQRVFYGVYGMIDIVSDSVYLYIPLLTMGMLSREYQTGSIALLFSSPIRTWQIVLGKYSAIVVFCAVLCGVLLFVTTTIGHYIQNVDYGMLWMAVFGIFLLSCLYGAVGLFMSSTTSNQVVAALATLATLALIQHFAAIADVFPGTPASALVGALPEDAIAEFKLGLFSSKNAIYFIALSALFLAFAACRLAFRRRNTRMTMRLITYTACIVTATGFLHLSAQPWATVWWDATRDQKQSLSEESKRIMKQIVGPWELTNYANIVRWTDSFEGRWVSPSIQVSANQKWIRHNRNVSIGEALYYDVSTWPELRQQYTGSSDYEIAGKLAADLFLNFDDVVSTDDVATQIGQPVDVASMFQTIGWGNKLEIVRAFNDIETWPDERHKSAAFNRMLEGPVRVGLVVNGLELAAREVTDPIEHFTLALTRTNDRRSLSNLGFDISYVRLEDSLVEKVDILIIADRQGELQATQLEGLQKYIEAGGHVLLLIDPYEGYSSTRTMLAQFGITVSSEPFSQEHPAFGADPFAASTIVAEQTSTSLQRGFELPYHLLRQPVILYGATALEIEESGEWQSIPLLESKSYDPRMFDEGQEPRNLDPSTLAAAFSRTVGVGEQRLVVVGDTDFMSDSVVGDPRRWSRHFAFIHSIFRWLSDDRYPIRMNGTDFSDKTINATRAEVGWATTVFYLVFPTILVSLAGIFLVRRQRS